MNEEIDLTKIVFFIFIILICLIEWADQKTELSRRNKLALFLSGLGSIALVLTIYDRKNAIKRDTKTRQYQLRLEDLSNQKASFLDPIQTISKYYPESADIFYQMFRVNKKPDHLEIDIQKQRIVEQTISLEIFQIVENFLSTSNAMNKATQLEWLSRMIFWLRSETLQEYFKYTKFMYSPDTVDLITQLVEFANQIKSQTKTDIDVTPEMMLDYAKQIVFVPRA
jgi:hypothetical protein